MSAWIQYNIRSILCLVYGCEAWISRCSTAGQDNFLPLSLPCMCVSTIIYHEWLLLQPRDSHRIGQSTPPSVWRTWRGTKVTTHDVNWNACLDVLSPLNDWLPVWSVLIYTFLNNNCLHLMMFYYTLAEFGYRMFGWIRWVGLNQTVHCMSSEAAPGRTQLCSKVNDCPVGGGVAAPWPVAIAKTSFTWHLGRNKGTDVTQYLPSRSTSTAFLWE